MIEIPREAWHVSSYSGAGYNECVEVAVLSEATAVRDSKHRDGGTVTVSRTAWHRFLTEVRASR